MKKASLLPLEHIGIGNRIRRLIWRVGWLLLYRPTPIFAHGWRSFVLRLFGARIEGKAYPYPDVRIWAPWNLVMEPGSCLASQVDCYNVALIHLGRGVTVSQKSYLCTASHDFDSPSFTLIGGPIIIGEEAWVAADAFVGPGVSIGRRAVILARSIVVRDVAEEVVVGGSPAKEVRKRAQF